LAKNEIEEFLITLGYFRNRKDNEQTLNKPKFSNNSKSKDWNIGSFEFGTKKHRTLL
jgi:hypothetical protein